MGFVVSALVIGYVALLNFKNKINRFKVVIAYCAASATNSRSQSVRLASRGHTALIMKKIQYVTLEFSICFDSILRRLLSCTAGVLDPGGGLCGNGNCPSITFDENPPN